LHVLLCWAQDKRRRIRRRSVDNVVQEMDHLHSKYGIREFHIEDDNFTSSKEFVLGFCKRLQEDSRRYYWSFPNGIRLDTLDEEMLHAMKGAGCYSLCIGIESGSDRILKKIRKGLTRNEIIEKIRLIRRVGLPSLGFSSSAFRGRPLMI